MKTFIRKHISPLLSAAIVITTVSASLIAFAVDNVELNAENFPDENFRAAIAYMYDIDKNGVLSSAERNTDSMIVSGVVEMYAFENDLDEDNLPVNNLKGIEHFENLKTLRCSSVGNIESMDLSGLSRLETLACNDLGLSSIILPSGDSLKRIDVSSNEFEALDLADNTALTRVYCNSNSNLSSLNLSGLDKLSELSCYDCALASLDLSTNTALSYLNCSYNHLIKLDLSNNTGLVSDGNSVTSYDIGNQESTASVSAQNGAIVVPIDLEVERIVSSSLDVNGVSAYSDGAFYTSEINLENGIDYNYNTGISDSALLNVHLTLTEKEHGYHLKGFDLDVNSAELECVICKNKYSVLFRDTINSTAGDSRYCEYLDVVNDGIINAKDFAALLKEYKE